MSYVSVPPKSVEIEGKKQRTQSVEIDGKQQRNLRVELKGESTTEVSIDCIAAKARPRPKFKWYLDNKEIKVS